LPFVEPQDQLVFYDLDLEGLPFYLGINEPAWLVSADTKSHFMGSFYISEFWQRLAKEPARQLLTFAQFAQRWKKSNRRLLIFVDQQRLLDLTGQMGISPKELLRFKRGKKHFLLLASR
jgi:hypothetical protein